MLNKKNDPYHMSKVDIMKGDIFKFDKGEDLVIELYDGLELLG